jgi:hypothetical protein
MQKVSYLSFQKLFILHSPLGKIVFKILRDFMKTVRLVTEIRFHANIPFYTAKCEPPPPPEDSSVSFTYRQHKHSFLLPTPRITPAWEDTKLVKQPLAYYRPLNTTWFKYDRDYLCVNESQFVPVIFEPPCTLQVLKHLVTRLWGLG